MATLTEELCGWASGLRLGDVPERVVRLATSQIVSQLAAARAGMSHPLGQAVIRAFGPPLQADPRQSASVLAGVTAWLHFDDTAYAGHLSHSTASVPMAYARSLGLDGSALLTAVIAANECAARIAASATLGPFRGQNAAHTHLAGAVAGRSRSEEAGTSQWVDALGIAFSMAPWPVAHGFLGSDAKVLSTLTPVRIGLDACDAAAAGLSGPSDVLEHPDGFLARFSTVPLPDAVVAGLGTRWHTETLSFKMHPGGPGADAAIDCAMELHHDLGDFEPADIAEVVVHSSLYTVLLDERISAYVRGAPSPVSALVLSTPYTVATTLLHGSLEAGDFTGERVKDPDRWALAARVGLRHDVEMTRQSMLCEVPFGEALRQAGPRAASWLRDLGGDWLVDLVGELQPPSETFEEAAKVTAARVTVRLTDGRILERERHIPVGAIGPETRRCHESLVRTKFLSTGGSPEVVDGLQQLATKSAGEVARLLDSALDLPH